MFLHEQICPIFVLINSIIFGCLHFFSQKTKVSHILVYTCIYTHVYMHILWHDMDLCKYHCFYSQWLLQQMSMIFFRLQNMFFFYFLCGVRTSSKVQPWSPYHTSSDAPGKETLLDCLQPLEASLPPCFRATQGMVLTLCLLMTHIFFHFQLSSCLFIRIHNSI